MKGAVRWNFASSVLGGIVVAAAFLALGVTGHRTTQTIVVLSSRTTSPVRLG